VDVTVAGTGRANVDTGFPVLDRLLVLLAEYARFDLVVALATSETSADAIEAAEALGNALSTHLRAPGVRGYGSGVLPVDEALAHVVVEVTGRPLLASNVDVFIIVDSKMRYSVLGAPAEIIEKFEKRFGGAETVQRNFSNYVGEMRIGAGIEDVKWAQDYLQKWSGWN